MDSDFDIVGYRYRIFSPRDVSLRGKPSTDGHWGPWFMQSLDEWELYREHLEQLGLRYEAQALCLRPL